MIDILFDLIYYVVNLFKWAVILAALFSILTSFGVLDTRNRIVWTIGDFLNRVTAPILNPIRRIIPFLGSIVISPIVAILLLGVLQRVIGQIYFRMVLSGGGF